MKINKEAQEIMDALYKAYGSDTGILFGIKSSEITGVIIQFTLDNSKREKRMNPVLIETHNDNGIEWGVGFTSSNPEPKDYVACKTAEDATKLIKTIQEI
jgi:hypothetical protein